jgi:GT2 family glycosyltransferase
MVERDLVDLVGPLRPEFDGAQDHDFLLRVAEACPPERVHHIPEILYHWRKTATSTAAGGEAKPYAVEAGRRAVAEHLARRGFGEATVEAVGAHTLYRTRWNAAARPSVTIIIPYRDQIATTRRCLETLLARTDWDRWTVVLVDNGSITDEAAAFRREFEGHEHVRFRRVDEPFNYSRLNNLAAHENPADFFVFLNNDVFVESDDWLRALVDEALADPKVAIVGAKLVYPDRTVQHAGVVLGVGGVGDHAFKGLPSDHPGYLGRAVSTQRMSAVTAALMLCRADIFFDVGGFDEKDLIVAFNDVDLCLKVGRAGRSVVFTCNVVAEHHESLSRGDDISQEKAPRFFYENQLMFARWHDVLADDPYYNKSFSRERGVFTNLA